jgi:threonine dehydratase
MNFDRLRHVAERADLGAQREALLAVEIPERPGSFLQFCEALGQRSITEFNYRGQGSARAHLFVGFAWRKVGRTLALGAHSCAPPAIPVTDMSGNEMAKLHVRYMIGGTRARTGAGAADHGHDENCCIASSSRNDPARCCASCRRSARRWNISLFHYRNHGSDYGRVLAGIQVPKADRGHCSCCT